MAEKEKKVKSENKQPLGSNGLVNAIITRESVNEKGMEFETQVFDQSAQKFIKMVEEQGADPIAVLEESKRLLEKGISRLKDIAKVFKSS